MLASKYFLYCAIDKTGRHETGYSNNPRVDAAVLEKNAFIELLIVQPPLTIWAAERISRAIEAIHRIGSVAQFQKTVRSYWREYSLFRAPSFSRFLISEFKQTGLEVPDLEKLFWGKNLLAGEIVELLKFNGIEVPWDPEDWLQYLCLQRKLQRQAAIGIDELGLPHCRRCGSYEGIITEPCFFCGNNHCFTCTNCRAMGVAKSCTPLYFQPYPIVGTQTMAEPVKVNLDFELTPAQARAAAELLNFLESGAKHFLVWAVCGGGKTEVSFEGIAKMLAEGGRVLYASPRREVISELAPRIEKAFPGFSISALYGGSGERFSDAPLVMATTHQCIRFYSAFDLVILDEADAFPYDGSVWLHQALEHALQPEGRLVIMTATPSKSLIAKALSGKIPYVAIPARHHRHPLIIPELIKADLRLEEANSWEPPPIIGRFIEQLKPLERRALIFLPTITLVESWGKALVGWAKTKHIAGEYTHSRRNNRDWVKTALNNAQLDFLVTSTLYERGITISNLDVLVLHAENERIFDLGTLIQIAGRVGRLGESSRLVFAADRITKSMRDCCAWISDQNRQALELGYIDAETSFQSLD